MILGKGDKGKALSDIDKEQPKYYNPFYIRRLGKILHFEKVLVQEGWRIGAMHSGDRSN